MISLVYYLRVIAVMWMGRFELELPRTPARKAGPVARASPEADAGAQPEVVAVAVLAAAATIAFGLWPSPLFDLARRGDLDLGDFVGQGHEVRRI